MRRSIRSATPASRQWRLPMLVHSSLTSQATISPSGGRASATASVTEISSTARAPVRRTRKARKCPCSGAICMPASGKAAVLSRNVVRTGCSAVWAPTM